MSSLRIPPSSFETHKDFWSELFSLGDFFFVLLSSDFPYFPSRRPVDLGSLSELSATQGSRFSSSSVLTLGLGGGWVLGLGCLSDLFLDFPSNLIVLAECFPLPVCRRVLSPGGWVSLFPIECGSLPRFLPSLYEPKLEGPVTSPFTFRVSLLPSSPPCLFVFHFGSSFVATTPVTGSLVTVYQLGLPLAASP